MAPLLSPHCAHEDVVLSHVRRNDVGRPKDPEALLLEGWAQGFLVGSLVVMSCITIANMRKGVLLHKLILLELLLGIPHGFWILFHPPVYTWWLSVSAVFLNTSWTLHNVIAWLKIRPFLPRWAARAFIASVALVQPYWVAEIFANFQYFHGWGALFVRTRPWEPLARDPWWVCTVVALFYCIVRRYELSAWDVLRISPRFVLMLASMVVSVLFIVPDVLSVTGVLDGRVATGINPFFKLSFVFKCLTDSVVLDDFKTALDRLRALKLGQLGSLSVDGSVGDMRFERDVTGGRRRRTSSWSWRRTSMGKSPMQRHRRMTDGGGVPPLSDVGGCAGPSGPWFGSQRASTVTSEVQNYKERREKRERFESLQSDGSDYAMAMREVERASRTSTLSMSDRHGAMS